MLTSASSSSGPAERIENGHNLGTQLKKQFRRAILSSTPPAPLLTVFASSSKASRSTKGRSVGICVGGSSNSCEREYLTLAPYAPAELKLTSTQPRTMRSTEIDTHLHSMGSLTPNRRKPPAARPGVDHCPRLPPDMNSALELDEELELNADDFFALPLVHCVDDIEFESPPPSAERTYAV